MIQLTDWVAIQPSVLWQTNTGIVQGPDGVLLIDPGIYPKEMSQLAAALPSPVVAGFCTHPHWDHILWHEAFGRDVPRFASTETVVIMEGDRERQRRRLSEIEQEFSISDGWDRSLLFQETGLTWGGGSIAGMECELVPIPGHCDGQAALVLPDLDVAFVADTLSDIETPSIHGGRASIPVYLESLDRLEAVIDRVTLIVPGHGSPADRAEARRRLDADRRYLKSLVTAVDSRPGLDSETIAREMLLDLDERRATADLSWEMHLSNIQQIL